MFLLFYCFIFFVLNNIFILLYNNNHNYNYIILNNINKMPYAVDSVLSGVNFIATTITNATIKSTSPFTNQDSEKLENMTTGQLILFFFILTLLLYIIMCLGAIIFNISIVKIFPSVKKVSTIDFFGLYIVTHLLFC